MKPDTFVNSYNEMLSEFANKVSGSFFERINVDREVVTEESEGILKKKFEYIGKILEEREKPNYEKLKLIGSILIDVTPDIMNSENKDLKKSGINIMNSFFEIAQKLEDNELLRIAKNISASAAA